MAQLELSKLKQMVENAADLTSEARAASERDRDYYDDHQWTQEEIRILQQRRQPVITSNRIKRKIDAMIGMEQRQRVDPKAWPRNPGDEDKAEAATKALVFVDDNTRFDVKRSMAFENMAIEGYGGVEVIVEERRGKFELVVNRLRWEEILADPHSREKDFSDAAYLGTQKWMTVDAATELLMPAWQGKPEELQDILDTSMKNTQDGMTYEDRPFESNSFRWADRRQKRVRVAQMYYRNESKWYLAIFCGGGEVYNEVSPYLDEDGEPTCPIILMTAYIDRENRRYGVVRSMISQQDEINKRRSKLLHQLNSRQTVTVRGAVADESEMKRNLAAPDGNVTVDIEAFEDAARVGMRPFEVLNQNDQIAGQFSLLQESKAEIDMFGPNPSLMGQTEGGASGRAIMAQQNAGLAELAPIYDSLRDWTLRVYRAMWERIKQFWTDERWVRVTDGLGNMEWLGFNRQNGFSQVIDMQTGQPTLMPNVENALAEMDVDIMIEDVPDNVTLQQEQFEQLAQMASNGIPIPPEMIIKASSLQDKGDLLQMLQEQRQAAAQAQAEESRIEKIEKVAELRLDERRVQVDERKVEIEALKAGVEVQEREAAVIERTASAGEVLATSIARPFEQIAQQLAQGNAQVAAALTAPKALVRDENGRPVGVRTVG